MEKKKIKRISSIATGALVLGSVGLFSNNANAASLTNYNDLGNAVQLRNNLLNTANPIINGAIESGIELKCGNAKTKKDGNCGTKTKDNKTMSKSKDHNCGAKADKKMSKSKDHNCGAKADKKMSKSKDHNCGAKTKKDTKKTSK